MIRESISHKEAYLFIGLVFGQNFVQSLHLKWVPMFLVIFFLLLNSCVRMCVGCTVKYLFRSFCGSSNLFPKLRWWDLRWVLGVVLHYVASLCTTYVHSNAINMRNALTILLLLHKRKRITSLITMPLTEMIRIVQTTWRQSAQIDTTWEFSAGRWTG